MKGISAVVGIVLLLLITISIAGLAFLFFGSIGQTASSRGEEELQQISNAASLRIEAISGGRVYIRNMGSNPLALSSLAFYIDNKPARGMTGQESLAPNAVGEYKIPNYFSYSQIKVTSAAFSDRLKTNSHGHKNEGIAIKDEIGRTWWVKSNGDGTFAPKVYLGQPAGSVDCQHGAIDLNDTIMMAIWM